MTRYHLVKKGDNDDLQFCINLMLKQIQNMNGEHTIKISRHYFNGKYQGLLFLFD